MAKRLIPAIILFLILSFGPLLLVISADVVKDREKKAGRTGSVLTLDEAIVIALRNSADMLLNKEKLTQTRLKIAEAKAGFLPEVTVGGAATDTRGLYPKDISDYSFQAGIKQYLFKGGKTANTLKEAKYGTDIQEFILDKTAEELVLKVKKAFYTLLIAKEFVRINKAILENNQKHLKAIQARYLKGEVPESDLLEAQASLANLQSLYDTSLNQLNSACVVLKNILYLDDKKDLDISGDFKYAPRAIALDKAILEALSKRPEIKQYELQAESQKLAAEILKAGNRPSIYASFDYYSDSRPATVTMSAKGWQDYNIAGVTFSWPVFDGLATRAKVEQAISGLKQAGILRDKIKVDIAAEVKEAYLDLKTGIAKLIPKEKDIELYRDNLKVARPKYKDGILSELDLEDVCLALEVAYFNQKQAVYECLMAKARLERAMGKPTRLTKLTK